MIGEHSKTAEKNVRIVLKITSKLKEKNYILFLPLFSLAGRFHRPFFRAHASVRARPPSSAWRNLPVYTIVGGKARFYLRRSRQVKACSMLFFLLLLLLGPFWLTHLLSKEVCSERYFTLPMCFHKRCVQRGVIKEVCSERCVQRGGLNLNAPPNLLLQGNTSQQKNSNP